MKSFLLFLILCVPFFYIHAQVDSYQPDNTAAPTIAGMDLKWSDEFDVDGKPNPSYWRYETGFLRNEELQWYQGDNANVKDGVLVLEAKREQVKNTSYDANSDSWKKNREYANYTSASVKTNGKVAFKYGRIEVRAKLDTQSGSWPAIWTLGTSGEWPSCGEIDILEFYKVNGVSSILANAAWGTATRWNAKWDSSHKPLSYFKNKDANWAKKFHIWRMDWDKNSIRLYLDNELLNETLIANTNNAAGVSPTNPFRQSHYFLLNLAIGANGGNPSGSTFPMKYEVDYIRVWQKTPVLAKGLLSRKDWKVYSVDSEDTANGASNMGSKAIDGDEYTFWHTAWSPSAAPQPHEIIIDLGETALVNGFTYLPRQDGSKNGTIANYELYASLDINDFGTAIKKGTFTNNTEEKSIKFTDTTRCRYVKLISLSEISGFKVTSCAEFNIFGIYEKDVVPSGINQEELSKGVQLYPNPTFGNEVRIDLSSIYSSNTSVHIINMQGVEVYKNGVRSGQNQLNPNLESGMYIIRITDGDKTVNKRLMVK